MMRCVARFREQDCLLLLARFPAFLLGWLQAGEPVDSFFCSERFAETEKKRTGWSFVYIRHGIGIGTEGRQRKKWHNTLIKNREEAN